MNSSKPTLIFDFDGTIADTFTPTMEILSQDFKKWGDRFNKKETIKDLRQMSITEIVQIVPGGWWKFAYLLYKAKLYLRRNFNHLEAYPGIVYVLQSLAQNNYPLYIVTSNNKKFVQKFLDHYGLGHIFTQIIPTKGLFNKAKTLTKVIDKYQLSPRHTYYIGDEIRDVQACHKANLKIISVGYGFNSLEGINRFRPDYTVKKPMQLLDLIPTLSK